MVRSFRRETGFGVFEQRELTSCGWLGCDRAVGRRWSATIICAAVEGSCLHRRRRASDPISGAQLKHQTWRSSLKEGQADIANYQAAAGSDVVSLAGAIRGAGASELPDRFATRPVVHEETEGGRSFICQMR